MVQVSSKLLFSRVFLKILYFNILISRVFIFAPAAMMGQRQASQPALLNGGPQPRVVTNGEDQGYYQNIGTAHLQQPMPLRYNNGGPGPVVGQQRFGSQSSLQQVLICP